MEHKTEKIYEIVDGIKSATNSFIQQASVKNRIDKILKSLSKNCVLSYSCAMAKWYGSTGRAAYIHARWTFDLAFPLVYTFFLITALSWFLVRVFPESAKWRWLNLIPLAAMLLDLLENSMTTLVMAAFPERVRIAEIGASVFTPLKWLAVGGSFLLLVVCLLWLLFRPRQN